MKLMSDIRKNFTADLYKVTNIGTQINPQFSIDFDRVLSCHVDSDGTGRLYVQTEEQLALETRLRNVKDKRGNVLTPQQTDDFRIISVQPILDIWGYLHRYRYTCSRVS